MTIQCPDCAAALDGSPTCPSCGLQVVGPTAVRLWQVDQRLALLDDEHSALREERSRLLTLLRSGEAPTASAAAPEYGITPVQVRRETSPQQVQNTLLSLGALLLALAGIVFAAVTYRHLGVTGRAAILIALTGAATAAPMALSKRGLTASAEAVGSVALVLGVVDAWALRRAGFASGTDIRTYDAVATALLAAAAGAYAIVLPLRAARIATLAFAQLPAAFALARFEASAPVVAVVLVALSSVDLLLAGSPALPYEIRSGARGFAGVGLVAALLASCGAVADHDPASGAGFLALALLAGSAATRSVKARDLLAGSAVPLVAAAAWATVRPDLAEVHLPLVLMAVAVVALLVTALLSTSVRTGPALGALTVAAVAVLTQTEAVLTAVAGPLTWLGSPWSLTERSARAAVSTQSAWTGTVDTLVVLVVAAGCIVAAGALLDRIAAVQGPGAVLLVLSVLALPLGLATSYPVALALLLGIAAILCTAGLLLPQFGKTLLAAGCATALCASVWSIADREATLTVLPVVALLALVLSFREPVLAGAGAVLAGASLAAFGASRDLSAEQVGGLLLIVPAVCVGLSTVLRGTYRIAVEVAAALLATTSIVLAVDDPGWLSWTVATSGLLCLAVAVRPDRREVGLVGGLLLSASSWVRLADAGVHAPEPYVVPLALAALVFGHLRRRTAPGTRSFEAYAPGLSLALFPTLLKAIGDPTPTRGLLLLVVCVGLVTAGARERLQAPLVIGGSVLAVDALHLLAPYASALPRWSLLAAAGALLVGVGATYEQRLREMTRMRERYAALG